MVPVVFISVEPDARRDDDFLRVFVEPGRPPGERAVCDDVVAAVSHQLQIEVAGAAVIDIHMDMGQGGAQVLPGPFYVVRGNPFCGCAEKWSSRNGCLQERGRFPESGEFLDGIPCKAVPGSGGSIVPSENIP